MFLKTNLARSTAIFILFLFTHHAQSTETKIPVTIQKIPIVRLKSSFELAIDHHLLQKCINSRNIPKITLPIVLRKKIDQGSYEYTINFNGQNLEPMLLIDAEEIPLEKTKEGMGYIITLVKPSDQVEMTLNFNIHSTEGEIIFHQLKIEKNSGQFLELLTDEQKMRLCFRNTVLFGIAPIVYSSTQTSEELISESSWRGQGQFPALQFGLNYSDRSWYAVFAQIQYAKIKSVENNYTFIKNSAELSTYDIGIYLQSAKLRPELSFGLFYPRLILNLQRQNLPALHLSRIGGVSTVDFVLDSLGLGLSMDLYLNSNTFVGITGLYRKLIATNLEKYSDADLFDGRLAVSQNLNNTIYYGLSLSYSVRQLYYSFSNDSFLNSGKIKSTVFGVGATMGMTF